MSVLCSPGRAEGAALSFGDKAAGLFARPTHKAAFASRGPKQDGYLANGYPVLHPVACATSLGHAGRSNAGYLTLNQLGFESPLATGWRDRFASLRPHGLYPSST